MIIASDMVAVLEAAEACHIIHLTAPDQVIDALARTPRLTAAILELNPSDLVGSDIETALNHHGARVVLTKGDSTDPEVEERGWMMLLRPFTDHMLRELLTTMAAPGRSQSAA
ncbi:hypothetical protein ACFMPD_09075 [Sedimentitalea sp. HM32M-2]